MASLHWCSNDNSSMLAIYIDKILWLPWLLTHLVSCQDHPIATLSTTVMYVNTCSEWIKPMGTIIDAQILWSKCMPSVITVPLCTKLLIDLAAPCCVCPTLCFPTLFIIVLLIIILWQSTMATLSHSSCASSLLSRHPASSQSWLWSMVHLSNGQLGPSNVWSKTNCSN